MMTEGEEQLIWQYLDGTLSDVEMRDIEQRLKKDSDFLALFEEVKALDDDLFALPKEDPSEKFIPHLLHRLPKLMSRKLVAFDARNRIPKYLAGTVIISLAIVLAIFFSVPDFRIMSVEKVNNFDKLPVIPMLQWSSLAILLLIVMDRIFQK